MTQFLIKARNVGVVRGGRHLLKKADLTLEAGKIVTLIGPNGAGKTTLVRSVLGLIKIDEGTIEQAPDLRISDHMVNQAVASSTSKPSPPSGAYCALPRWRR